MATMFTLPSLPVSHRKLPGWIQSKPKVSVHEIVQPYNEYDAVVRKLFAQEPSHSLLEDTHLNVVPLYNEHDKADIRVRARQVESESPQTKEKYIIPLKDGDRRPTGSPAVVPSLQEFSKNFTIFSEGALSDLDWSNVVVAGSAVVTCLLPVPEQYNDSKRSLRKFYHEKIAPASDVDLFLYGLDEQQALDKIRQIEERIKNTILYETTTIRAKNAITIVSQYPTRHIQIVLRIYKSVAEILTGFDVDCSCAAFDGRQVYVSPRALASYITQINTIDLTRRSPSYENRLSKYSHRGFEIFWPDLDRSQVDPTIFERSFTRVVGLARLLVLERLPKQSDRDSYIEQRREERGRPAPKGDTWWKNKQHGDLKSDWEDEVPEWEADEVVSSYETFRIPYGPRYNARRIERLIYAKDLLLNAEWNKKKERQVNLHRHPAFFGNVDDVIQDCCGFCPKPVTPEDFEVAGKESKIYVSGEVSFIKDDPGRQEIGSFNPTTETDETLLTFETDMAYFGHTEVLCQAIVDCDLDKVQEYVSTDAMSINSRDCTGRTPLHLACMTSTSSIVQCLVDHGARLVSRLADGRTALHLAAARGSVDMVRILLRKSEQNEEAWGARKTQIDEGNDLGSAEESKSCTSGSFVKVDESPDREINDPLSVEDAEDEPDIYDINAVSWDNHTSALHLAILNGHAEVAHELVSSFGADVLLPVKLVHDYNNSPRAAILTLVLVLNLEPNQAARMTKTLLQLGASPTQADMDNATPLTYMASSRHNNLLDVFLIYSGPATRKAINYFTCKCCSWYPQIYSPLLASINFRNLEYANMLLQAGANPSILFEQFVKPGQGVYEQIRDGTNHRLNEIFRHGLTQPVMLAVQQQLPLLALSLLELGADANTLTPASYKAQDEDRRLAIYESGMSLLDCVKDNLKELRAHLGDKSPNELQRTYSFMEDYLSDLVEDTYQWWATRNVVWNAKRQNCSRSRRAKPDETSQQKGQAEKDLAVQALICDYEKLEEALTARGAKPLRELYPKLLANEEDATEPAKPKLFKARLTFTNIRDMTAKKHKAYIDLFQAAWAGDLETVKYLTLTIGDAEHDHLPLQIAVLDQHGFSPFSIAALRGHRQLAKIVLEIAQAQYKLEEPDVHEVYDLDMEDEDMSSDEDSDNIRFRKDVVDNRFTIEDIGEVAGQVRSEISAYDMFLWNFQGSKFLAAQNIRDAEALDNGSGLSQDTSECPNGLVEYAIWVNDVELLRFLLKLGQEFVQVKTSGDAKIYRVTNGVTQFAMRKGHTDCLEELLRNTGADLPIDIMLQSCGIDIKKKPKYYQGLSIHGKKRADWAAAGRGNETSPRTSNHPLLLAAFQGNLKSVEWYLSSAPERLYSEFITEHEQEPRLKLLAQQGDRMTAALTKWLSSKNHLLLHCAVLSYTTEDSTSLVKYLVQRAPQYLETKSAGGYTPLALAFALHRTEFAQILIDAGADQTTRDKKGNNLIHLALCDAQVRPRLVDDNIEQLLKLLDARLASSLLTERSSDHPGSLTPFARWLHSCGSRRHYARPNYGRKVPDILATARCVLNFARPINQKFLEMFDGAGNTPLHEAVRFQYPGLFKLLLEYRPDLLFRENAVGSTPLELATDSWVTHVTSRCPPIHPSDPSQSGIQDPETKWVFNRSPETFAPGYRAPEHPKITIYKIAREQADSNPRKRRLVSLNEATEVTKRLALRSERKAKDESEDDGEDVGDEVTRYYGMRV
ncbi:ankyrin repeat protein [Aspergillus homomorphus CBS 101889]|uniref:Ankyrin repeat protein n=1 Tax=Aspergillus homomorphus (strain CBS 101889) TaxID=1450537 RepID=A0A395HGR2_ASPHC|nr:ankyrin repeat protein [Aspergillus homomorphus CBS 101889]RAL07027.1 ankyrin repeat protein [Aspergillus homomorphus CBS 101889]